MKYALLLSGQPIYYNESVNSLSNLNKNINCKHLCHFWWDSSYQGKVFKLHFTEKYENKDLITSFINNFKIDKFIQEPHKDFDLSFCKKFNYSTWGEQSLNYYKIFTPITLYGLLSQTYSVKKSFDLINDPNEFDVIIKSRPDIIFTKKIDEIIKNLNLDDKNIYFQSSNNGGHLYAGEHPNRPCDWFFLGGYKAMNVFTNKWYSLIKEEYINGIIHTNDFVKLICEKNGLKLNLVDFGALIYKQTNDYYNRYLINPHTYTSSFDYEKSKPLNENIWPYWVDYVDFKHFNNII